MTITLAGSTFAANSAAPGPLGLDRITGIFSATGARGGAVAARVGAATAISVEGCTFGRNWALGAWGSGGALSVLSHGAASVSIRGCRFDGNAVGMSGGAVAVTTSGNVQVRHGTRSSELMRACMQSA